MKYKLFDSVVLERNLPQHRVGRGDVGAVVMVYDMPGLPLGLEVEFFDEDGETLAVLTLDADDVRPANNEDRPLSHKPDPHHAT